MNNIPQKEVSNKEPEKVKNTDKSPEKKDEQPSQAKLMMQEANAEAYATAMQISTNFMSPTVWKQMGIMANTFIRSRALPDYIKNAEQAIVVMQSGLEMGLKPIESTQDLYILKGNINFWGKAVGKQLRKHGWIVEEYKETNRDGGTCMVTVSKGDLRYSDTFTFKEAEQSGYTTDSEGEIKPNWKEGKNRILKLRYNALDKLIRSYIPEVYGNAQGIKEVIEDWDQPEEEVEVEATESVDTPRMSIAEMKKKKDQKEEAQEGEIVEEAK